MSIHETRNAGLPNLLTLKKQGLNIPTGALRGGRARKMHEDVYMNAEELSKWLASQQAEMTQYLAEMGLALKK